MYTLYCDIERSKEMKEETKKVEKADSFKLYTRN